MMVDPWDTNPPATLNGAVELAKALLVASNDAEAALMRYLRWLEGRDDLWRQSGEPSFDSFLEKVVGVKARRYADAKVALDVFGVEKVERMGLQGAVVATLVPEEKRPEAEAKILAIRDVNGAPATTQNARSVLANAHLLPPVVRSRAETKLSRVAELEKAVAELRREKVALLQRAETAEARAESYAKQLREAGLEPREP